MSDGDVIVDFTRFAGGAPGVPLPRGRAGADEASLTLREARNLDELYAGMRFSGFDVFCAVCPGTTHPGCCRQEEIRETAGRLRRRLDQLLGRNPE